MCVITIRDPPYIFPAGRAALKIRTPNSRREACTSPSSIISLNQPTPNNRQVLTNWRDLAISPSVEPSGNNLLNLFFRLLRRRPFCDHAEVKPVFKRLWDMLIRQCPVLRNLSILTQGLEPLYLINARSPFSGGHWPRLRSSELGNVRVGSAVDDDSDAHPSSP